MKTDKEYPATHSMSTAWYCVDEDGNVGIFDIEDNGPVPENGYEQNCVEEVFWEDFSHEEGKFRRLNLKPEQIPQMLEPSDVEDVWEDSYDGKELVNTSWMNVIIQIDMGKFDILKKAIDLDDSSYRPLVCLSEEQGLFYVDFFFNEAGVKLLKQNNVVIAKYKAPEYNTPQNIENEEERTAALRESSKYPLFLYLQDYWPFARPAVRLNNPQSPIKLEQLPKEIQEKVRKLPLKFRETERIQLAELMPVDVSCCPEYVYDGKVWLQLRLSDDTNGYYCEKIHKLIRESEFKKYLEDGSAEEFDWDKHRALK